MLRRGAIEQIGSIGNSEDAQSILFTERAKECYQLGLQLNADSPVRVS